MQKLDDDEASSGLWLPSGAAAAGSGVWAAELILMLGYAPASPASLSFGAMAISAAAGILCILANLTAHQRLMHPRGPRTAPLWVRRLLSGAIMGLGLFLIHVVVLAEFRGADALRLPWSYQGAALGLAMALSAASRIVGGESSRPLRAAAATVLVALAAGAAHFVSVAGDAVTPGAIQASAGQLLLRSDLAAIAAGFSLLVLLAVGAMSLVESKTREKGLRQLQTATNAMPAALAFFDSSQRLVVWNATFAQIAGPGAQVRKGMPIAEMVEALSPQGGPQPDDISDLAARKTMEYPIPGGQWIRVEMVPTDDGGLLSVGIDITEIKRSQEALAKALDKAEAANRAKSEFLANMSHEIRTPLNGVSGLAEVLARTRLTARQRELVDVIRSSAQTVDALIGDILDLASMEAGQAQAGRAVFQLADLVRQVAAQHRPGAEAKGLRLVEAIAAEAETRVLGDATRLGQVLHNLLSNAVKFTEQGEVRLGVSALGEDRYRLEVLDTGVGFDPADRARLFDSFAQGDSSSTRRFSGAGLGLALVSHCARLMDARLDCSSTPGAGTAFTFDVRLASAARGAPAPAHPETAPQGAAEADQPLQVLIVDDNPTNRRVLELVLAQLGAVTHSVENGQEALDAFIRRGFDLILMDIQMPVMDGLTATRAIRAHERSQGLAITPVIIVSANCMPEHVQAGLEAGAQQCLGKPIKAAALAEAISQVVRPSRRAAA